jgi:hypothetical protein
LLVALGTWPTEYYRRTHPADRAFMEAGAYRAWNEFGVTPLGVRIDTSQSQ